MNKAIGLHDEQVTNGASRIIEEGMPYIAHVTIQGNADLLMHRYQADAVEAKAKAAKGSSAKKSDDIESYVYRCDDGTLGIPGEYLRQSIITAAKSKQDPRSPRKSAMDLFKAGVITLTPLASLGLIEWHYEDRRRVVVQRSAITRVRPAIRKGWTLKFEFLVNTPEYISPDLLLEVIGLSGRLVGIADFRPTYGRFSVVRYDLFDAADADQ